MVFSSVQGSMPAIFKYASTGIVALDLTRCRAVVWIEAYDTRAYTVLRCTRSCKNSLFGTLGRPECHGICLRLNENKDHERDEAEYPSRRNLRGLCTNTPALRAFVPLYLQRRFLFFQACFSRLFSSCVRSIPFLFKVTATFKPVMLFG